MSDSIDNNKTKETTTTDTKTSLFKRMINAIWGGLKFCFSKFKAVFIFLGSSIIFGIFTFIVSRSSIKEKEKKNDIEENGETVKDNIDEIKETVDQTSEDIKKIKETIDETSENKKKQKEKNNETQKEKAESLGFKKVK